MKALVKMATLLVVLGFLGSCEIERPISVTKAANNPGYKVEYLFEHDGCKVYRFMDFGHYVYFTNCQGDVTHVVNDSVQLRTIQVKKDLLPE